MYHDIMAFDLMTLCQAWLGSECMNVPFDIMTFARGTNTKGR